MASIPLIHPDGSPHLENIEKIGRIIAETRKEAMALLEKKNYWRSVLWKGGRVEYWVDALIGEGVGSISDVTWPVIFRMRRNPAYKHLGKVGEEKLATLAGIGPRPVWVPGRWQG